MPLNPKQTAERLSIAIEKRNLEAAISRFQLSSKGICELAEKDFVDNTFLTQLSSELTNLSWCMFQVSNTTYSFIRLDSARKFRKLSGEKLAQLSIQKCK